MATSEVLTLDDPAERWLPTAPRTGITLLHLARHTSGLPRLPPGRRSRRDPHTTFDRPALDRLLPQLDMLATRPPG
ncbi:serine hydrolase [Streptomyces sp. DG2A-72]|uniref:serine hydrolase n=1 Tax=Streptomyces sp. DG2A-72 TaxID=3051386 RepID=UPI00265BB9FC|nr:serine hydrolase [Streptomyces sp. DG2A-72]MDO0935036.1 serine hydrolase [Streptomyces sp. DG2A-72]